MIPAFDLVAQGSKAASAVKGWATRARARRDLIRWIEGWFNARRPHSSLDNHSPIRSAPLMALSATIYLWFPRAPDLDQE